MNERIETDGVLADLVAEAKPNVNVQVTMQASVRYSTDNPHTYVDSNLIGTSNLLEALCATPSDHLLMA